MPLAGSLTQFALADVIQVIESRQMTGCLYVENGARRAAVFFSGGQWLLAERIGQNLTLAQQLARAGVITPAQFERATGVAPEHVGDITDVQTVRMLISARFLTQERLRAWAVDDAVALLGVILSWPEGEFFFEEGVVIPQGRVAIPLPTGQLLAQAQRLTQSPSAPRQAPPLTPETVIDFAELEPGVERIRLTREQWKFLTAVDGQGTLMEVSEKLQQNERRSLQIANELIASGVLLVAGTMEGSGPQPAVKA